MDPYEGLIQKIEGMLNDERRTTSADRHWLEVAQRRLKDRSFCWVDPKQLRTQLRRAGKRQEKSDVTDEAWEALRRIERGDPCEPRDSIEE